MTSPDHYRLAEQLADEAYNEFRHDDEAGATALAAIAQVHAPSRSPRLPKQRWAARQRPPGPCPLNQRPNPGPRKEYPHATKVDPYLRLQGDNIRAQPRHPLAGLPRIRHWGAAVRFPPCQWTYRARDRQVGFLRPIGQ